MLANVLTKTVRDRVPGMLVGSLSVGVMLVFSMAVYRDVDVSFYFELPPAILELMGIPADGGVGALALGAMYNLIGAFTLAGLAIGMGASAIAGEERQGTIGLLLGNPVSRQAVVVSKAASMAAVTAVGSLVLWGFALVAPLWLGIDTAGLHIGAIMLALYLNALVYGSLALALGSLTGSRYLASAVPAVVMVAGYLGASLLPLTEGIAGAARLFPWHYFDGSQPLVNGVDMGHTAVLAGLSALFIALAWLGVGRRDLREKGTDLTIADRLRAHPRTRELADRLAGSARVSRVAVKTASESQGVLAVTAIVMLYMGLTMGPLYGLIPDDFIDFVGGFPDALIAMIGGVDMATPAGFIQAEVFSIVGPIAFIAVTARAGAAALAGEEEAHTMGLLLGNPISRTRLIVEKAVAMAAHAVFLGVVTFGATWAGVLLGGLGIPPANIASVSLLLALLGLVYGGVALAVGAATGRSRPALGVAAGLAVVGYFMFSFFPLSEAFEPWARLSPFTWYLGSDPLGGGLAPGDAVLLLMAFAALVGVSPWLFARRDLRG